MLFSLEFITEWICFATNEVNGVDATLSAALTLLDNG